MGIFDELEAQQQDSFSSLATAQESYTPPVLSLLEQKKQRLSSSAIEKEVRLDPQAGLDAYNSLLGTEDGSVTDLAEASMYRAGGNLADVGRTVSNKIFDTGFDDTAETGWSNPEIADQEAGVSVEQRQAFQADQHKVLENVADGDVLGAIGSAAKVGLPTLMDSAATMAELAAGTAVTAATAGAGSVLLAKKVKDTAKAATNIAEAYSKIKDAKKASKAGTILDKSIKAIKSAPKVAGQHSLMTADLVQQQRNEYKETYGEEPSAERLATMTALTLATSAVEMSIFKSIAVPKIGRAKVVEEGKVVEDAKLMQQFVAEGQRLIGYVDESALKSIAKRAASGVVSMAKAGGMEAGQEYVQTWAEILGVHAGSAESIGLLEDTLAQFTKENSDQAITGALLGAAAGGTAKAISTVPAVAAGTTADVTKGVVKAASNKLAQIADEKSAGLMTQAQRDKLTLEYERDVAKHEELVKENFRKTEVLKEVTSLEELQDEVVRAEITDLAKGEDLNDPVVFEKKVNALIRGYKADAATSKVTPKTKRGYETLKAVSAKLATDAVEATGVTKEDLASAVDKAKELGIATVEDLKSFNTSATYGLVEAALSYSENKSRQGLTALNNATAKHSPAVIRKMAKIVEAKAPETAKALESKALQKEENEKARNLRTDKLVNFKELPRSIKDSTAALKSSAISLASDISDTMKGVPESIEVVKAMELALKNYVEHEAEKGKVNKGLSENEIAGYKEDLAAARERFEKSSVKGKAKAAAKTVNEKVESSPKAKAVVEKTKDLAGKAKDKVPTAEEVDKAVAGFIVDPSIKKRVMKAYGSVMAKLKKEVAHEYPYNKNTVAIAQKFSEVSETTEEGITAEQGTDALFSQKKFLDIVKMVLETDDPKLIVGWISGFNRHVADNKAKYESYFAPSKKEEIVDTEVEEHAAGETVEDNVDGDHIAGELNEADTAAAKDFMTKTDVLCG